MDEYGIRQFVDNYTKANPGLIRDYTFTSVVLDDLSDFSKADLSSFAGYPDKDTSIVGIEQNYLNCVFEDLIILSEYDKTLNYSKVAGGVVNVVDGLYTNDSITVFKSYDPYRIISNQDANSTAWTLSYGNSLYPIKMLIAEGLRYTLSLTVETPASLTSQGIKYPGALRASAAKIPGFLFSAYQEIAAASTTLISMPDFREILDSAIANDYELGVQLDKATPANSTYNIPKGNFLLRFATGLSAEQRSTLKNSLSVYVPGVYTLVLDLTASAESISSTLNFLNLFFIIVAAISLILSFFLILVSFVSNIQENAWEFGVLRAIGLNKDQMSRVYIYEALCLTVGASILGSIVGIVTAISIIEQFNIFTEMPFEFSFPYAVFFFSIGMAVLTAVIGSKLALDVIKKRQISSIVKGLDQ